MENPFESGHIKNYILLYVSVVVIMILFFIASTLFNEIEDIEKKTFLIENNETNVSQLKENRFIKNRLDENGSSRFKLLQRAY